ncbi:FeoA family protein [Desulfothermus okinawensis JCM 13304]
MDETNYKTIRKLKVNQRAKIIEIRANGELGRRIRDMGIVPGAEIMVIGRAPLKDPVAIRINNFTITLRNNEADYIIVDTNL